MNLNRFTDFYDSYHFLKNHNMVNNKNLFNGFKEKSFEDALYVMVVKVNPQNETIEDDEKLNTATRVWLEFGPIEIDTETKQTICTHDARLDCGGKTFEEAIIKLANLAAFYYSDNGAERYSDDLEEAKIVSYQYYNEENNLLLIIEKLQDMYEHTIKEKLTIIDMKNKVIIDNPKNVWDYDWEDIK